MKHRLQILFTSVLFLLLHLCGAQEYTVHVQQYGIEDGIADRAVYTLFKDSHGFLWVASNKELQRFDGQEFKSYPIPEPKGAARSVTNIREDKKGWLWMLTDFPRTVFFLHPLTGEMRTAREYMGETRAKELEGYLKDSRVNVNIFANGLGTNQLYFEEQSAIAIFDLEEGMSKLDVPNFGEVRIHLIDSQGNFWVTPNVSKSNGLLTKLSPSGKVLGNYEKPGPAQTMKSERQVFEWDGHIYYFISFDDRYSGQQLCRARASGQKEMVFTVPDGYQGIKLVDGRIWCLGPEGWKVFGLSGNLEFELKRADYDEKLFEGQSFKFIAPDRNGQCFLVTEFGFNIIEVRKNPFIRYFSNSEEKTIADKKLGPRHLCRR